MTKPSIEQVVAQHMVAMMKALPPEALERAAKMAKTLAVATDGSDNVETCAAFALALGAVLSDCPHPKGVVAAVASMAAGLAETGQADIAIGVQVVDPSQPRGEA